MSGLALLEKGEIHNNVWDLYQLELDTAGAALNPRDWHFVVADHQCNTTDVLSFPHEPKPPRVIRP